LLNRGAKKNRMSNTPEDRRGVHRYYDPDTRGGGGILEGKKVKRSRGCGKASGGKVRVFRFQKEMVALEGVRQLVKTK